MNTLSAYAKAGTALVLTVLTNLLANFVNGSTPWPQTSDEWIALIVTSLVATLSVAAIPNTTTNPEVAANQSVRLKTGRHALPE